MRRILVGSFLGLFTLTGSPMASAAVLDFETPGQLAGNFRDVDGGSTLTQTSNGADNDYANVADNTSRKVLFYDTTPGEAATADSFSGPLTIESDIRMGGGSFGVYLLNADNLDQAYLALFNYSDRIRISDDVTNADSNDAGGLDVYDQTGTTGVTQNEWTTLRVDYLIDGDDHPVITVTVGSFTSGPITLSDVTAFDSLSIGLRISPQNGATAFDNFTVVPEPGTAALAGLGAALCLIRRKRR